VCVNTGFRETARRSVSIKNLVKLNLGYKQYILVASPLETVIRVYPTDGQLIHNNENSHFKRFATG